MVILLVDVEVQVDTTDVGVDAAEGEDVVDGADAVEVLAGLCVHDGLVSDNSVLRGWVVNESGVMG